VKKHRSAAESMTSLHGINLDSHFLQQNIKRAVD